MPFRDLLRVLYFYLRLRLSSDRCTVKPADRPLSCTLTHRTSQAHIFVMRTELHPALPAPASLAFALAPFSYSRPSPLLRCCATTATASPPSTSSSKPRVFVAGGTGNVGTRLVRLLSEAGCAVTATSRSVSNFELGDLDPSCRELVTPIELDVKTADVPQLQELIGDANVVVSTLGAPFSFGRVDGAGITKLARAAYAQPSVSSTVIVSSIGVGRPLAFPAAALNLFGGVLLFKDYSEQQVRSLARDAKKKFLIVRPGGMESPTDEFGLTHNVKIEPRNTLAGGLVSNLQIAQLIVEACLNEDEAMGTLGKTVEVVAETDAPKVPLLQLLQDAQQD